MIPEELGRRRGTEGFELLARYKARVSGPESNDLHTIRLETLGVLLPITWKAHKMLN